MRSLCRGGTSYGSGGSPGTGLNEAVGCVLMGSADIRRDEVGPTEGEACAMISGGRGTAGLASTFFCFFDSFVVFDFLGAGADCRDASSSAIVMNLPFPIFTVFDFSRPKSAGGGGGGGGGAITDALAGLGIALITLLDNAGTAVSAFFIFFLRSASFFSYLRRSFSLFLSSFLVSFLPPSTYPLTVSPPIGAIYGAPNVSNFAIS